MANQGPAETKGTMWAKAAIVNLVPQLINWGRVKPKCNVNRFQAYLKSLCNAYFGMLMAVLDLLYCEFRNVTGRGLSSGLL